jgi:hypothetical protein
MDKHTKWLTTRVRLGWGFLAAGILVMILGLFAEQQYSYLPYNFRIITGLGILFVGIGVGYLVRYGVAMNKDQLTSRRLAAEETDERSLMIRNRAGNRAYWVSTAMVYGGLLWTSFAANGSLPALNGNVLWYFLVACVMIPFGVYAASILSDQRNF